MGSGSAPCCRAVAGRIRGPNPGRLRPGSSAKRSAKRRASHPYLATQHKYLKCLSLRTLSHPLSHPQKLLMLRHFWEGVFERQIGNFSGRARRWENGEIIIQNLAWKRGAPQATPIYDSLGKIYAIFSVRP